MRTLVFDLDGTLVNTIYDIAESMNKSLAEHGFNTHPHEQYYNFIGEGVIVLVKKAIGNMDVSDEIMMSVLNRYNEIYSKNSTILSRPYDNMLMVLDTLISTSPSFKNLIVPEEETEAILLLLDVYTNDL